LISACLVRGELRGSAEPRLQQNCNDAATIPRAPDSADLTGFSVRPNWEHTFVQLSDWSLSEISERIVYLDARAQSRKAEWLAFVAEFDRRGAAHRRGFRSTAEWLAFECKMDGRTARDYVRVSRRLEDMPKIAEAFGDGWLSYSQVRALSRVEDIENEQELLRVALTSTTNQLEHHVRQLRSAASADLDVANRGRARRFVRHFWEEDGSLRFFGRLAADDGAAFVEALETRAAALYGEDGDPCCAEGRSRPSIGARRADALVELVTGGGAQTQVVLHADTAALACVARSGESRAGEVLFLRDGPAIPSDLARRLTCDAMVSLDGLNSGRTTRVVSPAQRRALEARDGRTCALPGCNRIHGLQAHHLRHWAHGGRTDLANLALFCHYHHRLFHDDGWTVHRERDGTLIIKDTNGRERHQLPTRASPARRAVAA
jgi:hypothetical protein